MEIQALITTYNRVRYLKKCISSLSTCLSDVVLNIWDNGSDADITKDYVREIVNLRKLNGGIFFDNSINKGTAAARNQGMSAINSEFILISDDDMWYNQNSLEHLKNVFNGLKEKGFKIGCIGLNCPFTVSHYKEKVFIAKHKIVSKSTRYKYEVHEVTTTPPNSWFINKEICFKVGGFKLPEGRVMGYSSWKMPNKMRELGYKFFFIKKINGKSIKLVEHMDHPKHKFNEVEYYKKYNEFRERAKHPSRFKGKADESK